MTFPNIPNHIEPLQLPLPWEPYLRMRMQNQFWRGNVMKWNPDEDDNGEGIREYLNTIGNQYIITGNVVHNVVSAVTWLHSDWPLVAETFTEDYDMEFDEKIEAFEAEALGVEAGRTWREYASGFGGGEYETSAVASLIGITADEYHRHIIETSPHPTGKAIIRSGNWLVHVSTHLDKRPPEKTLVGEVSRLSKIGIAVLESTLSAYEAGKNE